MVADSGPIRRNPALAALVELRAEATASGVPCLYAGLDPAQHRSAAIAVAVGIATRRVRDPRLLESWRLRATGEGDEPPSERDSLVLAATLLENVGTPDAPASDSHLRGLVAEALWVDLVSENDIGPGTLIRIEGHDWSSTDPGGDGLTVYEEGDGYCYRLWESKYHGSEAPIRETVNEACRQIGERALKYLARFSLVEQHIVTDRNLATFYGRLAELWVDRDPAAGVGIAIGAKPPREEADCFDHVIRYFGLTAQQHQGHLHVVGEFSAFAERVRQMLWKGCGLWIER